MIRRPPRSTLFPSPPLSRSHITRPCGATRPCHDVLERRAALERHHAGEIPLHERARFPEHDHQPAPLAQPWGEAGDRSEEHTSELQSRPHLVCRLLLEKKKK